MGTLRAEVPFAAYWHRATKKLRRDRRIKSPGVPGAAIAIFAGRRDRRIKSPISGMSDIGD